MNDQVKVPQVELVPVEQLIPYARNARTHSEEHVAQIAASMIEFGWTNMVLADGKGIVAGHGRVLAAERCYQTGIQLRFPGGELIPLGMAPKIDCTGWSEAQRKAYILADNKLALNAGWDEELLKLEMQDLKAAGFDLSLTGFELPEIKELFSTPAGASSEATPIEPEQFEVMLDKIWQLMAGEWDKHMQDVKQGQGKLLSPNITPGIAAWHFVQAKYVGDDYPRWCSLGFAPDRFFTNGDVISVPALIERAARDNDAIKNVRFATQETAAFDRLWKGMLPAKGARMPLDFPAMLARDLIDEFTPDGGSVLDPCHGWGGRYTGYLLSRKARRYVGFDPSPVAHAGLLLTRETLAPFAEGDKIDQFIKAPFEDFPASESTDAFDFALTSPPYFDVEKYDGDDSSFRRYQTFEDWTAGFYFPMIANVSAALKPGGVFALQVGSQRYPLAELAKKHAPDHGFTFIEQRASGMVNNFNETAEDDGEVIVILKKD